MTPSSNPAPETPPQTYQMQSYDTPAYEAGRDAYLDAAPGHRPDQALHPNSPPWVRAAHRPAPPVRPALDWPEPATVPEKNTRSRLLAAIRSVLSLDH